MSAALDFATIVTNLSDVTGPGAVLWQTVSGFCYMMSFALALVGIFQIKDLANDQGRTTFKTPVLTFFAMAMLAAAPETIATVAASVYGDLVISPISTVSAGNGVNSFRAILNVISLFGYIFFIRGIFVLKQAGQPDKYPQASIGKSTVILISGMSAIYIQTTLTLIGSFTGWQIDKYLM
jgi:hypothetical protein